jgi:hypothetical protein
MRSITYRLSWLKRYLNTSDDVRQLINTGQLFFAAFMQPRSAGTVTVAVALGR